MFFSDMKNIAYYLLWLSLSFVYVLGLETIVPVGVEGNDSVTFIREVDELGNYDMGYNENVLTGGASFHREKGFANGTRQGSYGYTTRNGLIRIVTYVADQNGYKAEVLTNEPGVAPKNPSDVSISKEQEPDPKDLAQIPTGYLNPAVASTNVVKNYVLDPKISKDRSDGIYSLGSAQVSVASPYGSYQYMV